jgi:hypothetical protein
MSFHAEDDPENPPLRTEEGARLYHRGLATPMLFFSIADRGAPTRTVISFPFLMTINVFPWTRRGPSPRERGSFSRCIPGGFFRF